MGEYISLRRSRRAFTPSYVGPWGIPGLHPTWFVTLKRWALSSIANVPFLIQGFYSVKFTVSSELDAREMASSKGTMFGL